MRGTSKAAKVQPGSGSKRGVCGVTGGMLTQLVLLCAVAVVIFIMGVGVGIQFFDAHGGVDPSRPWLAFTKQAGVQRTPPGYSEATSKTARRNQAAASTAAEEREEAEDVAEEASAGGGTAAAPAAEEEAEAPLLGAPDDAPVHPPSFFATLRAGTRVQLDAPMDALEVSGGAWIYLDGQDRSASIKTVMSNRAGGCLVDDAHRGWSLFVNNWESGDKALVLEWRDSSGSGSGCARLSSEPNTIPYDEWVHIGFAFQAGGGSGGVSKGGPGKAMLFVNGKLLRTGTSARKEVDVQQSARSAIGATADGQYPWSGRIAHAYVVSGVITPRQLAATMKVTDMQGWGQFGKAAAKRLLGLFLFTDSRQAVSPADLTWTPAEGQSQADLQSALGQRTFRQSSLAVYELTGKVDPVGMMQAQPGPEKAGKRQAGGAAKKGRKAPARQVEEAPPQEQQGEEEEEEEELQAEEVPQAAKPRKQYSDGASGVGKVPTSIARTSIPGKASSGAFDFTGGGNQWVPTTMRVPLEQASGRTDDPAALAAGTFSDDVTQEQLAESDRLGRERAAHVKAAMSFIWVNYEQHAWGMDELKPRGGRGDNNWAGIGMTLLDSLDTLWVMGMTAEFARAREWVESSLDFNKHGALSVFETTIRALGGLLAAYDLSGDKLFLTKAKDLGDRLMPAFNTPTGIPRASITLATGSASNPSWTGGASILSELGTLQVEFRYLSKATGQVHYGEKAEAVIRRMDTVHPADGLYPIYISSDSGTPTTSSITFGALGDSFYEYLIKVWVQGGRNEAMYRRMYDAAMDGMTSRLLKRSSPSRLAYVADWDGGGTVDKMDHLVCFVPGMLALGAYTAGGTPAEEHAVRDLINAKSLAYTCWQMYERHATGIAPEYVEFPGGGDLVAAARAPFYILRPEAAESLYILHQLTGNPVYREWGWRMFSAIEKYCKTQYGYGAHPDVRDTGRVPDDRMESFFMAETLKYLYMLQSPDHTISLDRYVFNTEAHPLSTWDSPRWKDLA